MTTIHLLTQDLLNWFQIHGRKDLPWKKNPTPYRVWVSEIMLQQTQVTTVIDYYQKFMRRFSSIKSLANADQDEVLYYWSGLGYYARARNLHHSAQILHHDYRGRFPKTMDALCQLPGIGRSTAGAIVSFSMNIRAPILDGNVKRVLTRYHAIEGIPTESQTLKQLWDLSEQHTPVDQHQSYNQAIMDFGATLCTRHNPACERCPVQTNCQAHQLSRIHEFPTSKKTVKKKKPKKERYFLLIQEASTQAILLEKRPPTGIWGSLWSFPECSLTDDINDYLAQHLNITYLSMKKWPVLRHSFTHFELSIHPILLTVNSQQAKNWVMESGAKIWYKESDVLPGGIPAPVNVLMKKLRGEQ